MIFKTNHMFWDENENTGYRHISVEYNDRVLLAITSYKTFDEWESKVIPMGFSFSQDEVQKFSDMFSVLPDIMSFLCTDSLTADEVQKYLDSIVDTV